MEAVILAAGFGERLKPHTDKTAKILLPVGGRPLIDHLVSFLGASPALESIHVRTNARHYHLFRDWLRGCEYMGKVELSENGVSDPRDRLGAVAELDDICARKQFKGDILVVAGDTIFDFPLEPFIELCARSEGDVVVVMEAESKKALRQGGVVMITADGRVIDFEEKPARPKSTMIALPFYRLSAESIPFLRRYLAEGRDGDCIGSFFEWSYRRRPLFAYRAQGKRYHLVDESSYRHICSVFEK